MITPTCSLFPGEGGWDPEEPAGRLRRWLTVMAVLVVVALLLLPVALAYRSQVERLRAQPPAPAPRPEPGTPGPGSPPGEGGAAAGVPVPGVPAPGLRLAGADRLETTLDHAGGLVLVRATHHGDGAFALHVGGDLPPRGGAGEPGTGVEAPLVASAGAYQGSRALGLPAGTYRLGVAAGGPWAVVIEPPSGRAAVRLPRTLEGTGDTATRSFEISTARTVRMAWRIEPDGTGTAPAGARLRVRVLHASGDVAAELVVAGGDDVEQYLGAGRYLLDVSTDAGVWRVLLS